MQRSVAVLNSVVRHVVAVFQQVSRRLFGDASSAGKELNHPFVVGVVLAANVLKRVLQGRIGIGCGQGSLQFFLGDTQLTNVQFGQALVGSTLRNHVSLSNVGLQLWIVHRNVSDGVKHLTGAVLVGTAVTH